jgi:ATP-dependent DNA helicase DinG
VVTITIITQKRGDAVGPLVEKLHVMKLRLLGTMSLWQSVDVPGKFLPFSLLLIAFHFRAPIEPVMSARSSLAD